MEEVRSGGTRAWRNNNPGNIRHTDFAVRQGSLGQAGGFAVFTNEQQGLAAIIALLKTETYQSLDLFSAITRYAPPSENNTTNYQKFIEGIAGISGDTLISKLSDAQLRTVALTIRRIEGWQEGAISYRSSQ